MAEGRNAFPRVVLRDRVAVAMCNGILRVVATRRYRDTVKWMIVTGMAEARRIAEPG